MQEIEPHLLEELHAKAVRFAQEAGDLLLGYFRRPLEVEYKAAQTMRDPVTEADKASERFLIQEIARHFPQHSVIGEEGPLVEGSRSGFVWILDPLDGTVNFMHGLPLFAVSIAVLWHGRPVVGAIYSPCGPAPTGGIYHARRGGGCFFNDQAIFVTHNPEPGQGQLSALPAHYWWHFGLNKNFRRGPGQVRSLGSIALEMALVASGVLQYTVFATPKIWDVAAGTLLVSEAGGTALSRRGKDAPWQTLESFAALTSPSGDNLEQLKTWESAVIAGNKEIAAFVSQNISRRSALWRRLFLLLR